MSSARAATPVDLDDRRAVEMAILDNPMPAFSWMREEFKRLLPSVAPTPWIRACWAMSLGYSLEIPIEEEMAPHSPYRQKLDVCVKLASSHQLYLEWAGLRAFAIRLAAEDLSFERYVEQMDALIDEIRLTGDANALAYALAEVSYEYLSRKIVDKSLPYLLEATAMLDSGQVSSILVKFQIRGALTMNLNYRGLMDDALQMDRDNLASMKALGLRHAAAEVMYNMGYSYVTMDPPKDDEARAFFQGAIALNDATGEQLIKGSALLYLSVIHSRQAEHAEALQKAQESIQIFIEEKDDVWVARSRIRFAESLIDVGKYGSALEELDQAWTGFTEEVLEYRNTIQWNRYRAWLGLGELRKALEHLELYIKGFREYAKAREKEEYNRAGASLGLQIAQERSRLLEKEKKQLYGFLAVGTLAIAIMVFALFQTREIRRQRKNVQTILDSVEEGILKFGRDGHIEADYSRYLLTIFDEVQDLAQRRITEVLYHGDRSSDERKIVEAVLYSILGENEAAWEMNSVHLPKELMRKGKCLLLLWTPLFNQARETEKIMLVLRDVTKARALELEVDRHRSQVASLGNRVAEIIQVPRKSLLSFKVRLRSYKLRIELGMTGPLDPELLRNLHTLKGEARSLGFASLSQLIHEAESALQATAAASDRHEALMPLLEMCNNYLVLMEQLKFQQDEEVPESTLIEVSAQAIAQVKAHLKKESCSWGGVTLEDAVGTWSPEIHDFVQTLLVHGLTNAADHGFVIPRRQGIVPDQAAQFWIKVWSEGDQLRVEVRDNGRGIDWDFVKEKAESARFTPKAGRPLTDVLFEDGVSSAQIVTGTSGRGVGLAAIQSLCESHGGHVMLLDNDRGHGALLRAEIPLMTRVSKLSA